MLNYIQNYYILQDSMEFRIIILAQKLVKMNCKLYTIILLITCCLTFTITQLQIVKNGANSIQHVFTEKQQTMNYKVRKCLIRRNETNDYEEQCYDVSQEEMTMQEYDKLFQDDENDDDQQSDQNQNDEFMQEMEKNCNIIKQNIKNRIFIIRILASFVGGGMLGLICYLLTEAVGEKFKKKTIINDHAQQHQDEQDDEVQPQENNQNQKNYAQEKHRNQNILKQLHSTQCIICWKGKSNSKLVCGHMFHFECIKKWMEKYQRCPVCKSQDQRILTYHKIKIQNKKLK